MEKLGKLLEGKSITYCDDIILIDKSKKMAIMIFIDIML